MNKIFVALLLLWSAAASAHRPSDAFLTLDVQDTRVTGQIEIALRDLAVLADLDANRDQQLSWGELRAAQDRLVALIEGHLSLRADAAACSLIFTDLLINDRIDGRYAWFALQADCPSRVRTLQIDYRLLFDLDPTHRGILVLRSGESTHSAVLGPDETRRDFVLGSPSAWTAFRDYFVQGVWHIWIGYDHILFLLALLLPAVLVYANGHWSAQPRLKPALLNVFGVITAFTLAHSVTLSLAALGIVRLPGVWVESAIALSVLLAALNNIWPLVLRGRWIMAFAFGLIHGFGFASVLGELGLPQGARLVALVAFNVGVEFGQLAIVLVAVPLAYSLRHTRFYGTGLRIGGSAVVALLATWWLAERLGLIGA